MAQQFGMNFQYGKRKISAMSNEEFNKLTPQQMQADFANNIKGLIPTFEQSLKDMRPFQRMIFVEMLAALTEAVKLGIDVGVAGADEIAHALGTHLPGHTGGEDKPGTEHSFLSPIQQRAHIRHGHREAIENRYGKPEPEPEPEPEPKPEEKPEDKHIHKGHGHKVTQSDVFIEGLPKAGQTQILERDRLIKLISKQAKDLQTPGLSHNKKQQLTNQLKNTQQKLRTLLAKYNWI